jgi:hypothetical protein
MVAKFNGKGPVKNTGANKPSGKPVNTKATIAKAKGGSANAGSGIGNTT